ncbi:GNAT family N-acetyltransferase [Candidatus Dependentiae bacterium]|nr:GNAT family N-acetyltransferase [Candidatus Dependentiae bacterium]
MQKRTIGSLRFLALLFLKIQVVTAANNHISPSKLAYERACIRDIHEILNFYDSDDFTEDDEHKLVVFPQEVRRDFLSRSIRKGRIWVAKDKTKIVGFLKLYLVDDTAEIQAILRDELRCIGKTARHKVKSDMAGTYVTESFGAVYDFDKKPDFQRSRIKYKYDSRQTYVYYGNAYTHPNYRSRGVNTALERYAFEAIKKDIADHIEQNKSKELFYLYGVVEDNKESFGRIRVFTEFVHRYFKLRLGLEKADDDEYFEGPTSVRFYRFPAFKPSFEMQRGKLVQLPDDHPLTLAGAGYGCLVSLNNLDKKKRCT